MQRIRVGFFSFTEITRPDEHHAYNEWHQLDHLPEQFRIPGVAHGQRWVSTPACRAARQASTGPLDAVHYVTLYLMGEPLADTLAAFAELGAELSALGRFHRHRRSHLAGPHAVLAAHAPPRVRIDPSVVPWRPHRGVHVLVEERRAGAGFDGYAAWLDVVHGPAVLAVDGVAGQWTFDSRDLTGDLYQPLAERRITVTWLDDDALAVNQRLDSAVAERIERADASGYEVTWAGPLETITPGEWDWFDRPAAPAP